MCLTRLVDLDHELAIRAWIRLGCGPCSHADLQIASNQLNNCWFGIRYFKRQGRRIKGVDNLAHWAINGREAIAICKYDCMDVEERYKAGMPGSYRASVRVYSPESCLRNLNAGR